MLSLFKQRLKRLSLKKKFVFFGSALTFLSAFLPWYSDIDRFNVGETYLGITGPVYLAGFITLSAAFCSFAVILKRLMGGKSLSLPISENQLHIFTSAISVLMLVMANSVFYHPDFGVSLADKTLGIGMILGFIGGGFMVTGAILGRNEKLDLVDTISIDTPLFEEEDSYVEQVQHAATMDTKRTVSFEREPKKLEHITRDSTIEEAIRAHQSQVGHNTNDIR